ncbi:hypothetical protein [Flammeovirga aprica]|uniref:Uncharacterized protein n=1 Tax=Flammeovirga aprica JL-4 TaxID=694437 RepID=A0A7X9P0D5_9BACT|nr:hypothetical protein [Flammeovirga aprica]NME67208.1 hypothetical protein [Flammeovirga aprica JL-4]
MINLQQALKHLQVPDAQVEPKEFSFSFIPISGKRKGQVLKVNRAVMNRLSAEKAEKVMSGNKPKQVYDPKSHNLNIRVIESPHFPKGVITVRDWTIVAIDDIETFI